MCYASRGPNANREARMLHRKVYLGLSLFGLVMILLPMLNVLSQQDFVVVTVGFGLLLVGIFSAIESVAKRDRPS
jgi:uncharacterized membrane protein HdeD (DUF308 family)